MSRSRSTLHTNTHARRTTQLTMNNGKRSINISLGSGSPSLNSRPNPFARPTRPSTTTALGFGDDDDDDDDKGNDSTGSTGPPKRKQIKLEHGPDDTEGQGEDAFSKLSAANPSASVSSASRLTAPPVRKSVFGHDDDDEEDAFSRLGFKKGTQMLKD